MPRFAVPTPAEPRLIGEMNTTPLIDVLLVLLIMFILTVPMATHKVALDLPAPGRAPSAPPVTHLLSLDQAGTATLDGRTEGIEARLRAIAATPADVLKFDADPEARYAAVDRLLAQVKRAGVTRMGLPGAIRPIEERVA